MQRLYKVNGETGEEIDYGYLSDNDILEVTEGYNFDKDLEIYTRKNSKWGFYTIS